MMIVNTMKKTVLCSALLAASRSWSALIAWTVAATAGACGLAAAGVVVAGASPVAAAGAGVAAGCSCLEQAPSATASNRHAHRRDPGDMFMDNMRNSPLQNTVVPPGGTAPSSRHPSAIVNRPEARHKLLAGPRAPAPMPET